MFRKCAKRLSAIVCSLLLMFSLLPAPTKAAAEGMTATVSGSVITITCSTSADNALVVCARTQNQRFEGVEMELCARGGSVSFPYSSDFSYQIIALDPVTYAPLCKSIDELSIEYDGPVDVPFVNDESEAVAAAAIASVASYTRAQQLTMELEALGERVEAVKVNGVLDETEFDAINEQLNTALDAWDLAARASGILFTTAEGLANSQEAALMGILAESGLNYDEAVLMANEDLEWAQQVTRAYDAAKSNTKLKELGMMMGCDARRAYQHLQMAQNILCSHAYGDLGNCAEKWEKTYTGIKAGAKVGLFVCATVATAGGTAAISAGTATVTVGQSVGIAVGGVDCALEVTSATGKIFLGPGSKVVQRFEDRTKPISEACFFYSICTGGGDTLGEKLACLGDIVLHDPNYQEMALTYVYDASTQSFRLVAANCLSPAGYNLAKKEALGAVKLTDTVPPLNDVISQFLQGSDISSEKLNEIVARAKQEGIITSDVTTDTITCDFQDAVAKDGQGGTVSVTTEQDTGGNDVTVITPRNDKGNIDGEQLTVDADGYIIATARYEDGELLCTSECRYYREGESSSYIFDRDGVHYDPTGQMSWRRTVYPSGYGIQETFSYPQKHHANIDYRYIYTKSLIDSRGYHVRTLVPRGPVG